jgi:hypothetical protein
MRPVAAGGAIWLLLVAMNLGIAMDQPWLGLEFRKLALPAGLEVAAANPGGPAAGLISAGDVVLAVRAPDGRPVALFADDIRASGVPPQNYDQFNATALRQGRIAEVLRAAAIEVTLADGRVLQLTPRRSTPLSALPATWIMQVTVLPAIALLIVILALRRRPDDPAARHLAVMGAGYVVIVMTAPFYTQQELAVPTALYVLAWYANTALGLILFAGGAVAVLWHYPVSLTRHRAAPWIYGTGACGSLVHIGQLTDSLMTGLYAWGFTSIGAQMVLAVLQWRRAAGRPAHRAMLKWFFAPWFGNIILYTSLYYVPYTLGLGPQAPHFIGVVMYLMIFIGLALGMTRFRLYYLNMGQLLVWFVEGLLVVALLAITLRLLEFSYLVSACLALAFAGVLHNAVRRRIWAVGRFHGDEFSRVSDRVVQALSDYRVGHKGEESWARLLNELFVPAAATVGPPQSGVPVALLDDGERMQVADPGQNTSAVLHLPRNGRALFLPEDVEAVEAMYRIFDAISRYWSAFRAGEQSERMALYAHLRDGLGRKIAALASGNDDSAAAQHARDAHATLLGIARAMMAADRELADVVDDIREETAGRCEAAGLSLEWLNEGVPGLSVDGRCSVDLQGIVREAVTNVIRHSGAARVRIAIADEANTLRVSIEDDGYHVQPLKPGRGLVNMERRARLLGGSLTMKDSEYGGLRVLLEVPVNRLSGRHERSAAR